MVKIYLIKRYLKNLLHNDFILNFRKRFDDFENGIKLFEKMKSGNIELEEAKNCKMCLNQI